ncbi:MAG: tRNA pseudouridine(55) synthase TruB [Pirellulales bacterium]
MFGVLNIHKPARCTSRDVVNRVQRLVRPVKVGHAGTLDPLATGVLLVCVGPATRLLEYAHRFPKSYRGSFLLGRHSASDDLESEVIELADAAIPTRDAVDAAVPKFVGEIMQRPPAFSAVKVEGRRAYKLARSGKPVELAEKPVTIHSLNVVEYQYPQLMLDIRCGSGTYIRSLGRDFAAELGTAAVMSALVRTSIGPFHLKDALPLDEVTVESLANRLQSPLGLLDGMPTVTVTDAEVATICRGIAIPGGATVGEVAAVDVSGALVAILVSAGEGLLRPQRVFLPERCN